MSHNHKFANICWNVPQNDKGDPHTWEMVQVALLMDIREELRMMNGVLRCPNFTAIPRTLTQISRNTAKKKRPTPKPKGKR